MRLSIIVSFMMCLLVVPHPAGPQQRSAASQDEKHALALRIDALKTRLAIEMLPLTTGRPQNLANDAGVYLKAAEWALRFDSDKLTVRELAQIGQALDHAAQRIDDLSAGQSPWATQKGRLVRGYRSAVDGSVQPYGLVIPKSYDRTKAARLDVVLHGSSKPTGMSELNFMSAFDIGDDTAKAPDDHDYIELHPLGRVENCYRWAGESDVFEAIDDVCSRYNIDRSRIVLRGMSMGASGTWHLGLKHPDRFVALGPYCGYVDTHRFSETPGMNFVKVGTLPEVQELSLHMLDSVDYAANAGMVPVVAAIGDKDPFFQAHVIMGEAMQREGLKMVNLISPGTGHVQDPKTWADQMRRIKVFADNGLDQQPRHIRFVTYTLKYGTCDWIQIEGMQHEYRRAEIDADRSPDGTVNVTKLENVSRFSVLACGADNREITKLIIDGNQIGLPAYSRGSLSPWIYCELHGTKWIAQPNMPDRDLRKRPGRQGPIDDAFTTPFLCVRGTGTPWNPAVQAWADANLKRFQYEWARYFRGDCPVKDDTQVTREDCSRYNLILFGDPGSNIWIRRAMKHLPIHWTRTGVRYGSVIAGAAAAPSLICPNPFNREPQSTNLGMQGAYLVINSGHTFHEPELSTFNYLLFPRLGDWAVFQVGPRQPADPSAPLDEKLLGAGYFNEQWK